MNGNGNYYYFQSCISACRLIRDMSGEISPLDKLLNYRIIRYALDSTCAMYVKHNMLYNPQRNSKFHIFNFSSLCSIFISHSLLSHYSVWSHSPYIYIHVVRFFSFSFFIQNSNFSSLFLLIGKCSENGILLLKYKIPFSHLSFHFRLETRDLWVELLNSRLCSHCRGEKPPEKPKWNNNTELAAACYRRDRDTVQQLNNSQWENLGKSCCITRLECHHENFPSSFVLIVLIDLLTLKATNLFSRDI